MEENKDIKKAADLLQAGELAIVIFTKGILFTHDALGNGETGNWVVDKENLDHVDRVIVYMRDEKTGSNQIFYGNYSGFRKSKEENRYIIRFSRLKMIGTTSSNWNEFASSGQNPVSYVGDFY